MSRLVELELTSEQREVHDRITAGPRGTVQGPLRVWLQSPEFADRAQSLGAFCRYGSALEPRLSELAIITVGAYWKAGFEWAVHAPLALEAGIGAAAIAAVRGQSDDPPFEREDERIVYEFAHELLNRHFVSAERFQEAVSAFGTPAVVDLVGILGYYSLICMTINAFEIDAPDEDPFA